MLAAQGPVACSRNDEGWRATAYDDAFRTPVADFSSVTLAPLLTEIAAKAGGARRCPRTIHPSGRFAANPSGVAVGWNLIKGAELEILANTVDRYEDAPLRLPFGMKIVVRDGGLRHCDPLAWINATDLLCLGGSNDLYTVQVNPGLARDDIDYVQHTEVKAKKKIAPETETPIISVAVSRDRRSLIIAAGENSDSGTAKLYRVSLTSPSDPVELGPIPAESREHFTLLSNFQQPVRVDGTSH
ncbi:hypothetical protein [Nonomuraea helvata]|uniref:Uncharacterized protein n=1 Tax=Nonomuraea helvata TaxID=37484 RepID=A0ABV5S8S1_9ACTN